MDWPHGFLAITSAFVDLSVRCAPYRILSKNKIGMQLAAYRNSPQSQLVCDQGKTIIKRDIQYILEAYSCESLPFSPYRKYTCSLPLFYVLNEYLCTACHLLFFCLILSSILSLSISWHFILGMPINRKRKQRIRNEAEKVNLGMRSGEDYY